MNTEQLNSFLRTLIQVAGTIVVSRGWVDGATFETVAGALAVLIVTGYGLWVRRSAGLVASAAALPGVQAIQAAPAIADAVPNAKVTAG